MKTVLIFPLLCVIVCCSTPSTAQKYTKLEAAASKEILYLFCEGNLDEGDPAGYKNKVGEIIVPAGKYHMLLSDSIENIGFVLTGKGKWFAINSNGVELFEVFNFDNGPDYVEEGLFRIVKEEKIGYANEIGEIVIPCKYACGFPFEDGKAKVTFSCEKILENEHTICKSDSWFYVNKKGEKLNL